MVSRWWSVCPSICCTYVCPFFCFRMITWVNVNGFSPNSVCALILWRSGLGLLMGKFCKFMTELSAGNTSVFSFPDDNFSKYHLDFHQTWCVCVCVCVCWYCGDLVWDCWKFCQFLTELSARDTSVFSFLDKNLSKSKWIFTKLGMCIDIVEVCFAIAHWQISSTFDRVICPWHDNGGVLSFHVLLHLKNKIVRTLSSG